MKSSAGILALGLAVLLGSACGRKGPLQPPLVRGPQAVISFKAHQRGGSVVLEWMNPARSVDGRPLGSLKAAEIWVLVLGPGGGKQPPRLQDFEARARLGRRLSPQEFRPDFRSPSDEATSAAFVYPFPADKAGSLVLAFSVRVLDAGNRPSKFCAPVLVDTRICPLPPEIAELLVFKDRVEVGWVPPAANIDRSSPANVSGYSVYRSEGRGRPEKLTLSPAAGPSFNDRHFSFGVSYRYVVRACAAGTDSGLESDDSAGREVTPRDTFPPDPPAGLVALAGPGVISLSWDPVKEEDLAGYRVWRRDQGGPEFTSLTPAAIPGNSFTDLSVEKGKVYVYGVSALDKNGNESSKTESGPVGLKRNEA
jgi:hypothetical protein